MAMYLANVKEVTAIYTSPLLRAVQTAEAVAAYHRLTFEASPELNDFDYGEWQGLSYPEVKVRYSVLCSEWANNPQTVRMPKGENLEDVRRRALYLIDRITTGGTAILISHRIVHKVLICALMGLDNSHIWNVRMDLCGVTTFSHVNNRFTLVKHNDTCFLGPSVAISLSDF